MKTKHYLSVGILGMAFAGLLITGCVKKQSNPPSNNSSADYTAAQDDANATFAIEDTKNVADGAAKGQANERMMSGCETIRKILPDTNINGVDSAIDVTFPANGCICGDGRTRAGHIIIYWNGGGYFQQGSVIGMTFKNYSVNNIGVSGTRTLTNVGTDSAGLYTWSFSANLTLTYPNNGGTATWISNRTNTLTKVGGIWYYEVTGSANGYSRKGPSYPYTISITSPIYVTAFPWWLGGCAYIESGKITVAVTGLPTIYVSFGTALGTCSNAMPVTVNGTTYNLIQL